MSIFKKARKAIGKGAKKGTRLAGKVAKQAPPYHVGQIARSLARGKTPKREDVLRMLGARTGKKQRGKK